MRWGMVHSSLVSTEQPGVWGILGVEREGRQDSQGKCAVYCCGTFPMHGSFHTAVQAAQEARLYCPGRLAGYDPSMHMSVVLVRNGSFERSLDLWGISWGAGTALKGFSTAHECVITCTHRSIPQALPTSVN